MRWQTATHVLGSLALSSCFVSPLLGDTRSAEYYSTHHEERKRVLKQCDNLTLSAALQGKDLNKEQKSMCRNARKGRELADQYATKQKKSSLTTMLMQCYTRMADGLEKGQDILKTDKKCRLLVRRSAFLRYTFSYYPLPKLYDSDSDLDDIYPNIETNKYDDPKIRHAILLKCYRTFSSQLRKYGSYYPIKTDFRHECRDALSKELDHPPVKSYDPFMRNGILRRRIGKAILVGFSVGA
ncbi:hypothetical protein HBZC1_17240 [Helicobacter bizzozeronii CIII-1]|uniref:Lipoprotein n=1 Tax=Helicobacter bizzozeronii (strain CIII-1) TaxID=1002804 RepID=F8KPI6_HELBC|nr:hypothetical protein [Helicobacter bizzozeronii]CCB80710.1 hypothetical protein HBZC1_17240 [Helicobacter bizzozeronii CIII-1]